MLEIEFKRTLNDADIYEKIGNICLKPIRLFCGKTVEIRGLTREELEAPLIVKIAAFALIFLTNPIYTLVAAAGLIINSYSKTYARNLKIYQNLEVNKTTFPLNIDNPTKAATLEDNKYTIQQKTKETSHYIDKNSCTIKHHRYSESGSRQMILDPLDEKPTINPPSYQDWRKERDQYLAPYKAKRLDNRSSSPLLHLPIDVLAIIITHLSDPKDVNSIRATSYNLLIAAKKARPIFTSKFILRIIDFINVMNKKLKGITGKNPYLQWDTYQPYTFDTTKWQEKALSRMDSATAHQLEQQCRMDAVEALSEFNTESKQLLLRQITLPTSFKEFEPIKLEALNTIKGIIRVHHFASIFINPETPFLLPAKTGHPRGPFASVYINSTEIKNWYDRTSIEPPSLIHYDWLLGKKHGDRLLLPPRKGVQIIFRCSSRHSTFEVDLAHALNASIATTPILYKHPIEEETFNQVFARAQKMNEANYKLLGAFTQ